METLLMRLSLLLIDCARTARYVLLRFVGERTMRGVRVIVRKEGSVLLVRHWYAPWVWTLPGGGVEIGEKPCDAARREVVEETGVVITEPAEVITQTGPMGAHDLTIVFVADAKDGALGTDGSYEIMERKWFAFTALPSNLKPGNRGYIERYAKHEAA
jgi:8-oxo-dGTP diphosphatase